MTNLTVDTVRNESASGTINVGMVGQKVAVTGKVKSNILEDSGGNKIFETDGDGVLTFVNKGLASALVPSGKSIFSGSTNVIFPLDATDTYGEYIFEFVNLHASTTGVSFGFQVREDASTTYDTETTSTAWEATHYYAPFSFGTLGLNNSGAQSSGALTQELYDEIGWSTTESTCGYLHLFNPASETYVKNYYSRLIGIDGSASVTSFKDVSRSGFFDTATALTHIEFSVVTGTFSGIIYMYGVK